MFQKTLIDLSVTLFACSASAIFTAQTRIARAIWIAMACFDFCFHAFFVFCDFLID